MFGCGNGETADKAAGEKSLKEDIQNRWPFLTEFDLSSIESEGQLAALVKIRSNISIEKADKDVRVWLRGRSV
jgi:hypothetical protein